MKSIIFTSLIVLFFSACGGGSGGGTSNTGANNNSSQPTTSTTTPSPTAPVARTKSVSPYTLNGNVTIASSYLKFQDNAPANEALVPYIQGSIDGKYVNDVLDGASISFDVAVPNDATTYGTYAGKSVKYVGVLFYPTLLDSNYTNPQTVSSWDVPSKYSQMEKTVNATPVFANANTKYPLIVYSHGIGGEVFYDGRNNHKLATHGYVVLSLFHGDKRFQSFSISPEELTLRSLAIKTGIDFLMSSKYKDNIDFDKIGAFGKSYGGTTAFILAGAKPLNVKSLGGTLPNVVSDSRIKVAVGIVPFMGDEKGSFIEILGKLVTMFGLDSSGASSVNKPYLAITGTADIVAVEKYTQAALAKTPADAHLVSMESESHEMTNAGSDTADTWALYFLNYYLKGDSTFLSMKDVSGSPVDTYSSPY